MHMILFMLGKFWGITVVTEDAQFFNISLGVVSSCLTCVSFTAVWTR